MVEDIIIEEEEKVHFPKVDRSRLYSVLLIILIMVSIYISVVMNMFWIAVFIVIPILSMSKREEVSQAKFNWKQKAIDGFSKLMRIILILMIVGLLIYFLIEFGILITTIIIFLSFSLYSYISASITRRNFKKNNRVKSEVF